MKRIGYRVILMLTLISSGPVLSSTNIPVAVNMPGACDFRALPGLEFVFAELDESLSASAENVGAAGDQDAAFVLWREQPSPKAPPLSRDYGGRHGKVTGRYFWSQGERWVSAKLDDCHEVFAVDTSRFTGEGPLMHLQSVGRIYYATHLDFAVSLIGQDLRASWSTLEPNHRLYGESGEDSVRLVPGELLHVLGVETRRYGFTKGLGGFYLVVRNAQGVEGLVKFHHDYLTGLKGEFLWDLQNSPGANGAVLIHNMHSRHAAE